jgi:CubicO group peptidase (beta-lactamase class C family)
MDPIEAEEYHALVLTRIQAARNEIKEIKKTCRVPSLSYGVLHRGEVIFRENLGVRDVEKKEPANADTLYNLASVSKCFLSALAGIAVAEGKLSWTALVSDYIPDFNPFDDPDIGRKARILDCLRHSAGVGTSSALVLGPKGLVMYRTLYQKTAH